MAATVVCCSFDLVKEWSLRGWTHTFLLFEKILHTSTLSSPTGQLGSNHLMIPQANYWFLLTKKKPKRKELGFYLFCFKQSVELLPCYLDCFFPHGETCRLLLFPSHTLSLGSCCRSFPLICLSHSFTECVSLNVIFFCVIHWQTSPGYSAAVKNSKSKWTHL